MTVTFDTKLVKKILLRESYVAPEDMEKAEKATEGKPDTIFSYLLAEELLDRDMLGQAIAQSFGVSYSDLNSNQPSKDQVLSIPEHVARKYRVVLFDKKGDEVIVATDNPDEVNLSKSLSDLFSGKITITYSLSEDIDTTLLYYAKPLDTRFSKIIKSSGRVAPEILDEIFSDALSLHVSDIHFEPRAKEIEVRFRIDGVLHEAGRIPKIYYENILNRLKVLSHERIDEHQSAQDGSLRFERDGVTADMRSSVLPTVDGEKVVLRILRSYAQGLTLSDLGLSEEYRTIIEQAASKPFGMIVVAGPTGSGKTTTLYALIKKMNNPSVNITTIEDPVEYKIEGINQIQVNLGTELTFARGLRSIVRQDPDIILVGEIRDPETAEISVNASLTGHLLFSTFHANDAATAIPRLLDMKIEPFLLSSTLVVVIAQRLVRKICSQCRHSTENTREDILRKFPDMESYFTKESITLYAGKGCPACNMTGFKGRTGIFELIRVTPELQELILKNPSSQEIWKIASEQGSRHLFEDGVEKVMNGITTLEELVRVAEIPNQTK